MSKQETNSILKVHDSSMLPKHIAVIMDGNGRWAKQRGLPRIAGHRKGVETARRLIVSCGEKGVKYLTLFAFSSENWRRPETEVKMLMDLFISAIDKEINKLHENNIRFKVIGDISRFNQQLRTKIKQAEELTKKNNSLTLNIAANYGGRWDIINACRKLAESVADGKLRAEDIDERGLSLELSLGDIPNPDLFIRTGGERRISNFLLWQLAYTELYFTDVLWPDFNQKELDTALASYAKRQRRFGQTAEQIEAAGHA